MSALALIDPKSSKPTRVRAEVPQSGDADKKEIRRGKVRRSVRSGVEIEKPAVKS
jgi:hypothetical protein